MSKILDIEGESTIASSLKSASTTVNVTGNTPSVGNVLTATSSSTATWQAAGGGGGGGNVLGAGIGTFAFGNVIIPLATISQTSVITCTPKGDLANMNRGSAYSVVSITTGVSFTVSSYSTDVATPTFRSTDTSDFNWIAVQP